MGRLAIFLYLILISIHAYSSVTMIAASSAILAASSVNYSSSRDDFSKLKYQVSKNKKGYQVVKLCQKVNFSNSNQKECLKEFLNGVSSSKSKYRYTDLYIKKLQHEGTSFLWYITYLTVVMCFIMIIVIIIMMIKVAIL